MKSNLPSRKAINQKPAKNDIHDNLLDQSKFKYKSSVDSLNPFEQLRDLLTDLNKAPIQIRNSPELKALANRIIHLMGEMADDDK